MGRGRVGHADHHVRVSRMLTRQFHSELAARLPRGLPVKNRIGPGEVDVLEDAARGLRGLDGLVGADSAFVDGDQLTGSDVAQELSPSWSSAQVSEATT